MAHFSFAVSGQILDLLTPTRGISDVLNVNSAEFNFRTPEWTGAEKWAHFSNPDYNDGRSYDYNLIDDRIDTGRGLDLPGGIWEVYLHGEVIEDGRMIRRIVTETQTIQIINSGMIDNAPIGFLEPSVAEQIDAKATAALNARITDATVDITENEENNGEPYAEVELTGEDRTKRLDFHFYNLKGETGEQGPQGETGPQGPQGDQGIQGPTGPQGPQGEDGIPGPSPIITATVSSVPYGSSATVLVTGIGTEGDPYNLAFYIPAGARGPQGEQGPRGLQGIQGPQGVQGATGATPNLTIGTVTSGSTAAATITGTAENPVLNLVIPTFAPADVWQGGNY